MAAVRVSKCTRTNPLRATGSPRVTIRRNLATRAGGNGTTTVVEAKKERKPSPLTGGGTLDGEKALGKDPASATKAKNMGSDLASSTFSDSRWVQGTWDLTQFTGSDGNTDWDAVIDAEMERRRILEENPTPSSLKEKVLFDTAIVPWWAWVRRFHLPEAEKINGRAAMVGYFMALVIDGLTGTGLWDQQNSFLGKVALNIAVIGIMFIGSTKDLDKFKGLWSEATFYDDQWNASWTGVERPEDDE
ncbi:light-harvesting complex-like protein [Chloropicon primus]|uniref:Uncharacterized protein n=1 Tax=Chloropicon primus TaxID=1764295 RepID=A0A5B8ML48_9CHLO|nr:hypothetical protein A3770_05p37150 [Chloropicon primus]UPR00411.1 light-harvesting complex-like protein [Chloropicon primus]|eukprot:QDZ21197.1 hypothetical protein A3770_05p37150 [Chloropicon primus]